MKEIVINGRSYASAEEMSAEHRQVFLQAVKQLSAQGIDEMPDVLEVYGNPDGSDLRVEATTSRQDVRVDGQEVEDGLEGLPPALRAAVDDALAGAGDGSPARPGPSSTAGPGADEFQAMLHSARAARTTVGPGRAVKLLLYTLVGLVLALLLLAWLL